MQLDLIEMIQAVEARERGMAQSLEHAEREHFDWADQAYEFLRTYAKGHAEFISEDVSDASKAAGFPQPPTDRAWGMIYRRAIKRGVIIQVGTGRSRRRHASICPRWGSLVVSHETKSVNRRVPSIEGAEG